MARQTYQKSRKEWKNDESGNTPVMAENLNHIEEGIKANSENMALKDIYGDNAVSLGRKANTTIGEKSFAFGTDVEASGEASYAEGAFTAATQNTAHAEGTSTKALDIGAHAEGLQTTASNQGAHAEGYMTTASNMAAHAEGLNTTASGGGSHAEGYQTKAVNNYQHVQGKWNVEDTENKYAHIVGGGTSDSDRKNIHTIKWNGDAWFAGNVADGNGTSINQLLLMIQELQSQIQSLQTP